MVRKGKASALSLTILFSILLLSFSANISQAQSGDYFFRVFFTDKGSYTTTTFSPDELLGGKAIARRVKYGIPYPVMTDLPVYKPYIEAIRNQGLIFHSASKWMNSALFTAGSADALGALNLFSFVKEAVLVKRPGSKSSLTDKLDLAATEPDFFGYDNPLLMLNGTYLHNSGYDGRGITIAVNDAGFLRANTISSLAGLRMNNRIKGTYDFVKKSPDVYGYHNHGTAVLSVLAGDYPGLIRGSAPGASYWLFRTEDTATEFPVEEDYWVSAAEFADSAGVDIITSSLGYSTFDDPEMDYKFSDMNGRSTFITRAAETAASKGILIVSSAGNERNKPWVRIVAPSDGKNVISAGAVDAHGVISSFSSAGPSADNRIKPDNVAQGVSVTIQVTDTEFARASGTSFSCPVLSGLCACIMQAVPGAFPDDIKKALHASGHKSQKPDSLYGYGIPDFKAVIDTLQKKLVFRSDKSIVVAPNPFKDKTMVVIARNPGSIGIEIFTVSGMKIYSKAYNDFAGRTVLIDNNIIRSQGLYLLRISTPGETSVHRIIKLPE